MRARKSNFIACLLGVLMLCALPAFAQESSPKKADGAKQEKTAAPEKTEAKKAEAKPSARTAKAAEKKKANPASASPAASVSNNGLMVVDAKAAAGVDAREPVNVASSFGAGDQVTVWAAIRNTESPADIKMVWFANDSEVSSLDINVGKSSRWRTWSKINVWAGDWKVEIQDDSGTVLKTVEFSVTES